MRESSCRAQTPAQFPPFTQRIVKAGFHLQTFMALHKTLNRCREKDALSETRDILLALIPRAWETINRHVPRNADYDEEVEGRPWKEWASDTTWNLPCENGRPAAPVDITPDMKGYL